MCPWKCNGRSLYYKYRGQVSQLTHMRRSEPDDLCGSEIKGDRKRGMFTMYEIGEICFGGYLCVVSMWDIRKREIPVWLIAAGGILSASLGYFHGKIPLVLMVSRASCGRTTCPLTTRSSHSRSISRSWATISACSAC